MLLAGQVELEVQLGDAGQSYHHSLSPGLSRQQMAISQGVESALPDPAPPSTRNSQSWKQSQGLMGMGRQQAGTWQSRQGLLQDHSQGSAECLDQAGQVLMLIFAWHGCWPPAFAAKPAWGRTQE